MVRLHWWLVGLVAFVVGWIGGWSFGLIIWLDWWVGRKNGDMPRGQPKELEKLRYFLKPAGPMWQIMQKVKKVKKKLMVFLQKNEKC